MASFHQNRIRLFALLPALILGSVIVRATAVEPPQPAAPAAADSAVSVPPGTLPPTSGAQLPDDGGFSPRDGDPEAPIFDSAVSRVSYQALLTDAAGHALPGPNVNLAFRIYTTGGVLVEGPILVGPVPITNGMVDVQVPVSRTSFDGTGRVLGVTVNPPAAELTPRIPLTAVPYAFRVDRVASDELDDSIDLGSPTDAGVLSLYRTASNTPGITLTGALSQISTFGSDGLEQIRLAGPSWGEITLNDRINNDTTVLLSAANETGGRLNLYDPNGGLRVFLGGSATGANFILYDGAADASLSLRGDLGGRIDAEGSLHIVSALAGTDLSLVYKDANGGLLETHDEAGALSVKIGSQSTAGFVDVYQSNGTTVGVRLDGDSSVNGGGIITVYQADGQSGMTVDGDSGGAGRLALYNTAGSTRVVLDGDDVNSNGGGVLYLYASDASIGVEITGNSGGAGLVSVRDAAGSAKVLIDGDSSGANGSGRIDVHRADGTLGARADGDNLTLYQSNGSTTGIYMNGDSGAALGGYAYFYQGDGDIGVHIDGDSSGSGYISVRNAAGTVVISLDGDVGGNGRVTTQELQITGGSDLSEQFDVQSADAAGPLPGQVVCIDPRRPGELTVSGRAYDRTVAGIISGAGGVRTGMMMGQQGTKADGKHPVALSGRVYVWCDASNGAIEPGDLLTTSATPGHAMKVVDHARAQGAILGKAMTSLASGRGLVLVLVTLQ